MQGGQIRVSIILCVNNLELNIFNDLFQKIYNSVKGL